VSAQASAAGATTPIGSDVVLAGMPLVDVVCPAATICEAIGSNAANEAVVVRITAGVPGPGQVIPGVTAVAALACPSVDFCEGVGKEDDESIVVAIVDGVPGPVTVVP